MTTIAAEPNDARIQQLEAELDPEMRFRPLLPVAGWIVAVALFGLSCFHYYTAGFGLLQETLHRGIHISCVLGSDLPRLLLEQEPQFPAAESRAC